jgi:thiosulfate dehydrogenase [quinone] large subunit
MANQPRSPSWPHPNWSQAGWLLFPLRGFLAFTFLFAGMQKLANPAFLDWNSPYSLHSMMLSYARTSPIHALLSPLVAYSTAVGIGIAVCELAVGIGMALGLFTRVAAIGGMLISLSLFLAVSFHTHPWYTGADIVFLFTFTPFAIAGACGVVSLDAMLASRAAKENPAAANRRAVVLGGSAALLGAALAGATAGLGRLGSSKGAGTKTVTLGGGGTQGGSKFGKLIGSTSDVPVGTSGTFTVPGSSGDPGLVIQESAGKFVAYNAVCPHLGCTVAFQPSAEIIACPCHGSEFLVSSGDVIQGPATRGLTPLEVTVATGDIYVKSD